MTTWQLAFCIGELFCEIHEGLTDEGEKREFMEGMRFLNQSRLPLKIVLLYLLEYAKRVE